MNITINHSSIAYSIEITAMPDEEGQMMEFRVLDVDLCHGVADYEDLLSMEDLYEEVLDELEKIGKGGE